MRASSLCYSVDKALASLVGLLSGGDAELQLQAVWCLTNLATGTEEQALAIVKDAGAYLATLLTGGNAPLEVHPPADRSLPVHHVAV